MNVLEISIDARLIGPPCLSLRFFHQLLSLGFIERRALLQENLVISHNSFWEVGRGVDYWNPSPPANKYDRLHLEEFTPIAAHPPASQSGLEETQTLVWKT